MANKRTPAKKTRPAKKATKKRASKGPARKRASKAPAKKRTTRAPAKSSRPTKPAKPRAKRAAAAAVPVSAPVSAPASPPPSYLEGVPQDHVELVSALLQVVRGAAKDLKTLVTRAIAMSNQKDDPFDR